MNTVGNKRKWNLYRLIQFFCINLRFEENFYAEIMTFKLFENNMLFTSQC